MSNPPTIENGPPEPKQRTNLRVWICLLLFVGVLLALVGARLLETRAKVYREQCAANFRSLGHGIYLYSQENEGVFPPDLQTAMSTQQMSAIVFTCTGSSDTEAKAPSDLAQAGHCSYIYVGANLSAGSALDCIVAVEDPANHNLDGGNILFADGHIEWRDLPSFMQVLNDLAIGKNPPAAGSTFIQASAKQDYTKNWQSRMPQLKSGVWMIPTTQPAAAKPSL